MKEVSRPCIRLFLSLRANPLGQRVVNFCAHVLGQERGERLLAGARRRLDETLGHERRHRDLKVAQQLPRSNVRDRVLVLGTLGRVRDLVLRCGRPRPGRLVGRELKKFLFRPPIRVPLISLDQ